VFHGPAAKARCGNARGVMAVRLRGSRRACKQRCAAAQRKTRTRYANHKWKVEVASFTREHMAIRQTVRRRSNAQAAAEQHVQFRASVFQRRFTCSAAYSNRGAARQQRHNVPDVVRSGAYRRTKVVRTPAAL